MPENRHMRRQATHARASAVARPMSPSLWLMAVVCFLALAVQSFIVQTHIHIPQGGGAAIQTVSIATVAAHIGAKPSVPAADKTATPRDKYPINEDPSNCPLCQEIAHSGQYVASAAVIALLPVAVSVNFIVFDEALPSFLAVSHIWQTRAPPLAS